MQTLIKSLITACSNDSKKFKDFYDVSNNSVHYLLKYEEDLNVFYDALKAEVPHDMEIALKTFTFFSRIRKTIILIIHFSSKLKE